MTTAVQPFQRRLLLRLLIVLPALLGLALILFGGHALATPPPSNVCFATADNGATVRASADAHAVQQAVDDASAGGTVKVAGRCMGVESRAGTSQSAYISKTLTLIGGYTNGDWATSNPVANPTVIDANGLGRVLRVEGVDATIVNLILQKGNFSGTGGALSGSHGLTLTNVSVLSSTASSSGGGVYVTGAARITDSRLQNNNSVADGGGLYVLSTAAITGVHFISNTALSGNGGAIYATGNTTITDSQMISNTALLIYYGKGGALYHQGSANLHEVLIQGNYAGSSGGGIISYGPLTVTNSVIDNNEAAGGDGGGGIMTMEVTTFISGTTVSNNRATWDDGGGICTYDSGDDMTIVNSHIIGNHSEDDGGGMKIDASVVVISNTLISGNTAATGGGGISLDYGPEVTLVDNTLSGNQAVGAGGGIDGMDSLVLTIRNTKFISNTAGTVGGALRNDYNEYMTTVTGSTFVGNRSAGKGEAIYNADVLEVTNSLFAGNGVTPGGSVIAMKKGPSRLTLQYTTIASPTLVAGNAVVLISGSTLTATNNIIANFTTGISSTITVNENQAISASSATGISNMNTVNEDYNLFAGNTTNLSGVTPGANSISGDFQAAGFVDAADGNYHLTGTSQAVNKGIDVGIATDFEGDVRPQGGGFDAGYDETPYSLPGTIVVQKVVVGAPPASAWQFSGPTPNQPTAAATNVFTLPAAGGSRTFTPLTAGDYTIAETQQPGFNVTSACSAGPGIDPNLVTSANGPIATGGASILVTLGAGQTITCTFTNTRVSVVNITIVKDAEPPSSTNFRFTGSYLGGGSGSDSGASINDFYLDDPASDDGDAYGNSKSFSVPIGAVYSFSEPAVNGWYLMSITCNPAGSATVNLATRSVTINTASGQDVICTFKNEQAGVLNVRKYRESNGVSGQQAPEVFLSTWTIRVMTAPTNTLVAQAATNALGKVSFSLKPGNYTVCEVMKSGWKHWLNPGNLCLPVTLTAGTVAARDFGNCLTNSCPPPPPAPVAAVEPTVPVALTLSPDEIAAWMDAWLQTPDGPAEETLEPDITEEGDAGLRVFLPLIGGQ